jgi:flagellar assembly factor FliW
MKTIAPLNPPDARKASGPDAPPDTMVVEFPPGIPGFETCRRFVVIASPELSPLSCLRSLDPPEASFLLVDPLLLDREYDLTLREFERTRLGATADDPLVWLAIVSVKADGSATANLRAPVVINARRMVGCQFIRDDGEYSVNFPLTRA